MKLDKDDIQTQCKIGQGADTCIWIAMGADGFECLFHERPQMILNARPGMTAQRDGCEREHTKKAESAALLEMVEK